MVGKSGQMIVLVLLLGLLGLTVSMSVVSRTLSDIKQVSTVDAGTKGLAAAEAGLEFGLNKLYSGQTLNCAAPTAVPNTLTGITNVTYWICGGTTDYSVTSVSKDDVFQLDLNGVGSNTKTFSVVWKNPNASVEITKLDASYNISRFAYNGSNVTDSNGFSPGQPATGCVNSLCVPDGSFNGGNCTGIGEIPHSMGAGDVLLRVKALYADTDVAVCAQTAGNSPGSLSVQTYIATASATTAGGAVRKIMTSQVSAHLPAVFDNVFYSGGNISK